MRRKTALERPKGSTEAHLILVKIYWFMFLHKTFDVSLNFLLAIWVDWWVQTDAFVDFRTKRVRSWRKCWLAATENVIYNQYVLFLCFEHKLVLPHIYAVAYGIGRDLHMFAGVVELCSFFVWISPQQQSEQLSFLWCIQRWIIYRGIKAFVLESSTVRQ